MEKQKRPIFPKGFFTQARPQIAAKEVTKDLTDFRWSKSVLNGKSKVKIVRLNKKTSS